jgi:acylphosphatase
MERLHAVVWGDVQGVGFRWFLFGEGRRLGLSGWVRNNSDGTVELVAEGPRVDLEQLRITAETGPRHARVDHVKVEWTAAEGGLQEFALIGA